KNSLSLNYPKNKIRHLWITDGSDDGTPDLLEKYEGIEVSHLNERNGKIGAINRGMKLVNSPIVIFCDANTELNSECINEIVNLFSNHRVGCVAGEKRIKQINEDAAAGAGEGIYWKYESLLKKWDSELYSAVGAAGELFAIRTELFQEVEKDTLLDDFIISLRIAMRKYTIQYTANAYATETASANVKEELKRKIRISAGGIQSIFRLKKLLNPFKYGVLSFQYLSHRVLRWTLTPLLLLLIIPTNIILVNKYGLQNPNIYSILLIGQILFYLSAIIGWILENMKIKFKAFFVPYYFFIMNLAVYLGFARFLKGKQSVKWERAKRG
ncbi:MAG: glycosyltransferase, partial [Bacteroidota bacterium]|nr:glycosyltransferase [Bacteroidota bacterium]